MPDEDLMHAYVQGEVAAFEVLYQRHHGALYRFVRRLLGQGLAAQADEVFQDCWLRIVQARDSFASDRGARWKTWAFTIAHNLAMDRLRGSGREVSLEPLHSDDADSPPLEALAQAQVATAALDDTVFWRAAGTQLLQCLDQLPVVQRAAFLLHHEQGASLEQVAAALNLGFETAKSRLRYALSKLRLCMSAYLGEISGPRP